LNEWTFAFLIVSPFLIWIGQSLYKGEWNFNQVVFVRRGLEAASIPTFYVLLIDILHPNDVSKTLSELPLYTTLAGFTGIAHTIRSICSLESVRSASRNATAQEPAVRAETPGEAIPVKPHT
jgi:hypothetical protein